MKRTERHLRTRKNRRRRLQAEALEQRQLLAADTWIIDFDNVGDVDLFGPNAAGDLQNESAQSLRSTGNAITTRNVLGDNNGSPEITGTATSATFTETDTTLTITGQLNVVDLNFTDTVNVAVDSVSVSGTFAGTNPLTNDALKAMMAVTPTTALEADPTAGTNFDWTFTSGASGDGAFNFLATGETLVLSYVLEATDDSTASGGEPSTTTRTVTVTIKGQNDQPSIAVVDAVGAVTESDAGNLTDSGTLNVEDLDVTDVVAAAVDSVSVSAGSDNGIANEVLKDMMSVATNPIIANGSTTGTITWTFDSGSQTFNHLGADETLELTYTLSATDDSNVRTEPDSATQTVVVTITGQNDQPTIAAVDAVGAVAETDAANLTDSGTLTVEDLDVTDVVTAVVDSVAVTTGSTNGIAHEVLEDMMSVATNPIIANAATTGTITWTFDSGTETFDYLGAGESLTLTYTLSVSDDSGVTTEPNSATQTVVVTITGRNDQPTITVVDAVGAVTESDAANLTDSGTLNVEDLDLTDVVTAAVDAVTVTAGSDNGIDNGVLQAMMSVATNPIIASAATTGTITWTFNSGTETFDYLGAGESLTLTYTISATDDSGATTEPDSATQTVVVTITGQNDQPTITVVDAVGAVTESDAANLTDSGTLNVEDLDLTDVVTAAVDAVTVTAGSDNGIDHSVLKAMISVATNPIIANAATTGTITWTFNSGSETFDYLGAGESLVLAYTLSATDDSGVTTEPNSATQTVVVTITGQNDQPTITVVDAVGAVTESDAANLTDSGTLNVEDLDLTDVVTAAVDAVTVTAGSDNGIDHSVLKAMISVATNPIIASAATTGTITWTFNSGTETFDYLAVEESLVLTYTLSTTDDSGAASEPTTKSQTVTVTIIGSNDSPEITGSATSAALTETGTTLTNTGTLNVVDIDISDLVTITVDSVAVNAASTYGGINPLNDSTMKAMMAVAPITPLNADPTAGSSFAWTFTSSASGNAAFNFLAAGETQVLDFVLKATDSSGSTIGESIMHTQTVAITIIGSNDAPVMTDGPDSVDLDETDAPLTTSGTLTVTDTDTTDLVSAAVTSLEISGNSNRQDPDAPTDAQLGTMLTVAPTGILAGAEQTDTLTWTFDSDNERFDYLANGETLILTYTVTATDNDATPLSDTETVTITITGTNDSPDITGTEITSALTETDTTLTDSGELNVLDIDRSDTVTITVHTVEVNAASTFGGTNPLDNETLLEMMAVAPITPLEADFTAGTDFEWTFTSGASGDAAFDFLAAGETLVLDYVLKGTDSSGASTGESTMDTQSVVVTITGSNDAPIVNGNDTDVVSGTIIEGADDLTETGSVTFTDVDLTDRPVGSEATKSVTAWQQDGSTVLTLTTGQQADIEAAFSISDATGNTNDGTVNWDYTISEAELDFLGTGEVVTAVFTITVTDDEDATDTQDVTVTITGSNDVPLAESNGVSTNEDTAKTFTITDFPFADVENNNLASITLSSLNLASGDLLTVDQGAGVVAVTNGMTITAAQIPSLKYTPAENANGSARSTFAFAVNDAGGGTLTATMSIHVTAVNDLPVASASSLTTNEDTAKTFAVTDFHFADVESDSLASITLSSLNLAPGDLLTVDQGAGVVALTNGMTITAAQIPSLKYTPAENANGAARSTFAFAINDAGSGTQTATMSINVTAVNDLPVASAGSLTTNEDTAKTFAVTDFHFADVESDSLASITLSSLNLAPGDLLTVDQGAGVVAVTNGMTITAAQIPSLKYTPAANANGAARSTFAFAINDAGGGTQTATMSINVTAVNDLPVASASSLTTNEDTAKTFAVTDFHFADVESDSLASITLSSLNLAPGDLLTVDQGAGVVAVTNGMTITAAQIPSLKYTPAENANGAARSTFAFAVNDAGSGTQTATMSINVTAVNDLPVASASSLTTNEDTAKTFAVTDFHFADVESDSLASITVSSLNLSQGDLLTVDQGAGVVAVTNGMTITAAQIPSLKYTPAANANGAARLTFAFAVNDAGSGTATATMSMAVLIANGSFETPNVSEGSGGQFGDVPGWIHGPGSTSPAGYERNYVYQNTNLISNRHGDQVVALQGHDPGWSLGQAVSTTAGLQHTLSFLYGMGGDTLKSTSIRAEVYLASNLNTPIAQTNLLLPSQHNVLVPASLQFTPAEGNIVVRFTETAAFGTFAWLDNVVLLANQASSLLAAGGQDSSIESQPAGIELTQDELQPIVDEAIARWNDVLDSETAATLLDSLRFEIADLPDALLGSASSTVVSLDTDAAGHGWFVDATPDDDAEFGRLVADTEYAASENSEAFGAIDLLTVVMHELGHVLGQAHTDAPDVMAEELATSTRRVPSQQEGETDKSAAIAVDSALRINRPSSPADLDALNITDDLVDLLAKDVVRPAAIS